MKISKIKNPNCENNWDFFQIKHYWQEKKRKKRKWKGLRNGFNINLKLSIDLGSNQ